MNQQHPSTTLSIEETITVYLDWQALRGSTPKHRKEIRQRLLALAEITDRQLPLDQVNRDHCMALLRQVQERGRKPNTQIAYFRALEAFFNWAVQDERLTTSPMDRVPKPKVPLDQIKPFSEEELAQLLAAPDRSTFVGLRDATFIALLADTGLRLTEAVTIRLTDLDTRQRSISVMGKGSKPRTVFYGEAVAVLLRDYLKKRGAAEPEERLFVNSLGEPLWKCTMSKRIRDYGRALGIRGKRVSPHTLRHTFAVFWLIGGGDAFSLQRLLGHSTSIMTSRYVNFTSQDLGRLHRSLSPLDRIQPGSAKVCRGEQPRKRLR